MVTGVTHDGDLKCSFGAENSKHYFTSFLPCSTDYLADQVLLNDVVNCSKSLNYRRPFMSDVCTSLVGNPGALPSPRKKLKNLELAETQFPAVSRGLLALFFVNILARSQFLPTFHRTPTTAMQIWTNFKTHIFKKWGYVASRPPLVAPSVMTNAPVLVLLE